MGTADLPTWDKHGVLRLILNRASTKGEATPKIDIDRHVHDESVEYVSRLVDEGWIFHSEGESFAPMLKAMLADARNFDGIAEMLDSAIKHARAQFEHHSKTELTVAEIFENYRFEGRYLFLDDSVEAFWATCGILGLAPFISVLNRSGGLPTRLAVSPSIQRVACLFDVLSEQQAMSLKPPPTRVPLPTSPGNVNSKILLKVRRDSAALRLNFEVKSATEQFLGPPVFSLLAIEHAREAFLAWGSAATALLESIFADQRVATEFSDRVKVRTIGRGTILVPAPDLNELKHDLKMGVLGCIDTLKALVQSLPRYQEPPNAPYLDGAGAIDVFNNRLSLGGALNSEVRAVAREVGPKESEEKLPQPANPTAPEIFISHSAKDEQLATLFRDLLQAALLLPTNRIRCTSVPGSKLPTGASSTEVLPGEISASKVFVGLLTRQSIESAFVLFELGARWGQGKRLFPLLGPEVDYGILPTPIKNSHAAKVTKREDMQQVLSEISKEIGRPLEPHESYESKLAAVLTYTPTKP